MIRNTLISQLESGRESSWNKHKKKNKQRAARRSFMVHLHHPSTTFVASVNDAQTLRSHKDPTQLACALPVADNLI